MNSELSETDFSQTIPFNMHRVTALSVAQAVLDLAPLGINVPGARVLVVVLQNDAITVTRIGELTCIDLSTLSHMLRRFEQKKWIVRKRLPADARSVAVSLSTAGKTVAKKVHAIVKSHQRTMLDGLSESDIQTLRKLIAKLLVNVSKPV